MIAGSTGRRVGALVAALLLPPLAVFLARGLGSQFWVALALTLLGFVPGMVFALYVLLIDTGGAAADTAPPKDDRATA